MSDHDQHRPERPRAPAAPGPARRRVLHHPLRPEAGHPGAGRRGRDPLGGPVPLADAGGQRRRRRRGRHARVGRHRASCAAPTATGPRPWLRRARPPRPRAPRRTRRPPRRTRPRRPSRPPAPSPTSSAPSALPVPAGPSSSLPTVSGTATATGTRPLHRSRAPSRHCRSTSSARWATRAAAGATGCSASSSARTVPGDATAGAEGPGRALGRPGGRGPAGGRRRTCVRGRARRCERVTLSDQLITVGLSGGGAAGVPGGAVPAGRAAAGLDRDRRRRQRRPAGPLRGGRRGDRAVRHLPDRLDLLPSGRGRDVPGPGADLGGARPRPGRPCRGPGGRGQRHGVGVRGDTCSGG